MNCLGPSAFLRRQDALPFVQAPEIAAPYEDVEAQILSARKVPCICPEQHNGACGHTLSYSTARGMLVERVGCDRCPRTWQRNTP